MKVNQNAKKMLNSKETTWQGTGRQIAFKYTKKRVGQVKEMTQAGTHVTGEVKQIIRGNQNPQVK